MLNEWMNWSAMRLIPCDFFFFFVFFFNLNLFNLSESAHGQCTQRMCKECFIWCCLNQFEKYSIELEHNFIWKCQQRSLIFFSFLQMWNCLHCPINENKAITLLMIIYIKITLYSMHSIQVEEWKIDKFGRRNSTATTKSLRLL